MDTIQSRSLRELILCETAFLPQFRDSLPDHDLNVALQLIRLWSYAALKHPA